MYRFNAKLRIWVLLWLGCLAWTCQAQTASRAIWIWEQDSYDMLESPAKAEERIDFFKRQGITTLYLYADAHEGRNLIVSQPQLYARLIANLHAQGMQVHACVVARPLR